MHRDELELDIENLVGFFSAQFYNPRTGALYKFIRHHGSDPALFNLQDLVNLLASHTIITFNGNNYDLPILVLALHGFDNATLKQAGDDIIVRRMKPWHIYEKYQVQVPDYIDHVDLFDVAPGVGISLKMYAGRMHYPTMIDLPVDPTTPVAPVLFPRIISYCDNDLGVTAWMRHLLTPRLELRASMSEQYGVDLRSKSDAQIAEAVIRARILDGTGQKWIDKRVVPHGYKFRYEPPPYIRFATLPMQRVFDLVRNSDFVCSDKEEAHALGMDEVMRTGVIIPDSLKGLDIRIGQGVYRLGIGGLHSQESSVSHYAGERYSIWDVDVKSYYPSLILGMGMYPEQLGPRFLEIYREIYHTRLTAKAAGDKTVDSGLKIVLNGTFGKLFSKWSILYAPEFGIRTTLTGQLALLMLIEMMELSGVRVASANTDGVVLLVPPDREWVAKQTVAWWERATGLEMEYSHYAALHSRDVNNYVAIDTDGKVKLKGVFLPSGMLSGMAGKHPDKDICAEAVVEFLTKGTPIYETVWKCREIRKFLQVRNVKGGGVYKGEYLGRAVRWYYGTGSTDAIHDAKSGNQVAGTAGCYPLMTLPDAFPNDVDFARYERIAFEMLADVGVEVGYWYHPESDCYILSHAGEAPGDTCEQITRKQYEKGVK